MCEIRLRSMKVVHEISGEICTYRCQRSHDMLRQEIPTLTDDFALQEEDEPISDKIIDTVGDVTEKVIESHVSTYTSLVSAFTYFVLGLIVLVCGIALAAYFGKFGASKKWVAKMLGRDSGEGSRRGRYEMVNKTHV
jgi:hypothetical protein